MLGRVPLAPVATLLLAAYVVLIFLLSAAALLGYRLFKLLPGRPGGEGHKVSIIVPAKEEADTLRDSLASLTAMRYPSTELIVVCGPSHDGTEDVANEFAGKMTVLKEPERPAGWMGKSWACHHGYLRSTGDVLLFADGDVIHSQESLRVALANLDAEKAGLLSLWPQIVTRARSERVFFPASLFFLCAGVAAASSRRTAEGRKVDGANGQYIMVRRDVYDAIGGHAAIKTEIMEDGAIGRRAFAHGFTVTNYDGDGYVKVLPYARFGEAWEAHERFGAGLVPSWGALIFACTLTLAYFVGPFALLAAGLSESGVALAVAATCACALVFATDAFFSRKASRLGYFLLAPLSGLLVTAAFAAGFLRFRRGGITWKGVKYGRDSFKPLGSKK